MNIVNLTGINISYRDGGKLIQIPPTGWRLVGNRFFTPNGITIGEADVCVREYDKPSLPPQEEGTLYLVDPMVGEAMQTHGIHRPDVVVSHGASAERKGTTIVASRVFYLANP